MSREPADLETLWERILSAGLRAGYATEKSFALEAGMPSARFSALKTQLRVPHAEELQGLAAAGKTTVEQLMVGLAIPPATPPITWTVAQELVLEDEYERLRSSGEPISVTWLASVGERLRRTGGAVALRLGLLGLVTETEAKAWYEKVQDTKRRDRERVRYESGHRGAAQIVKKRDRACVLCGSTDRLQAAHIQPFRTTKLSVPDEMVLLCRRCHRRYDKKMERTRDLGERQTLWYAEAFSRATGVRWCFRTRGDPEPQSRERGGASVTGPADEAGKDGG